jgi:hypothetical protein
MASKRGRGGGFRPPELKGTLGTLLRTTLHQAGVVADAARDALGQGRARLDDARQSRRRTDALAELGEIVLELVRNGEIDVGELPEARSVIEQLEGMDASSGASDDRDDIATPPSRGRFDTRGADDGTVSSGTRGKWTPPKPAKPLDRVWRPPTDERSAPPSVVATKGKPAIPAIPRKGGISFEDDDEDLASYMHPDDVPPKPPADE